MLSPKHSPKYYAEQIYQSFCESDETDSELAKTYYAYQDIHGEIQINDPADKLMFGAIHFAVENLIIHLQNEEYDRGYYEDL